MTFNTAQRVSYLNAFIIVLLLLGGASYLELYKGVTPCPLCILQRVTLAALGMVYLFGIACGSNKRCNFCIGIVTTLLSLIGIIFAARQVWLQVAPSGLVSNCEVGLQYMLRALPLKQVLQKVYAGGAACSQVGWEFLHISLAEWSLACFIAFLLFSIWQLRRKQ